ncbi:MAG: AmmeMemoRadiSam system protein B, partial [Deltaproteobacteria bacterium]|nr:AmmeMemoRadiSam system protein B [Deltaproteobacteria bacterium]
MNENSDKDGSGLVKAGKKVEEKVAKKVIDSPVAGSWYTADGDALRRELRGYLDEADLSDAPRVGGRVAALISPHAGYRFSGRVEAYGYKTLEGADVRRIIIMGPSHHVALDGYALTDATHWRTPLGEVPIDQEAV